MDQDNYFSLFSIPVNYTVDKAELTSRYLALQKAIHPDKFSQGAEQERLFSVQQTAKLNEAYNTLINPLLRARYLLQLNGFEVNEQNTIMDPAFLMQQMELREAISLAKQKQIEAEEFEETIDQIDDLYKSQLQEIQELFNNAAPQYDRISDAVKKLQFISKLREEADDLADTLVN